MVCVDCIRGRILYFDSKEEGGYLVHVPALNGLTTEGETIDEAHEMAKDAIIGYLEALRDYGSEAKNAIIARPVPRGQLCG
ncbi:type II toxin-antitoxin system HicB family antitoxin [Candidatus Entotheonella palauensis]|uniref:type II toxin-antitoxin system HicB family antitoxin n=1 Tax=Candidatus Entotheonella palauensis TaxID=93172 RepID=UPI000B7F3C1C|nr:type II toxin-antitoxin system HicB family antitoxin [Candidatus Entotheonella palauensis]